MEDLFVETGTDVNASGSATWELDGSFVNVAVYGPDEAKYSKELTHRAYVDVEVSPEIGMHTPCESELECYLTNICERVIDVKEFPRSVIRLRLHVLSGASLHPCTVSAATNASLLALMNAGLPLRASLAAVTVSFPNPTSTTQSTTHSPKKIKNTATRILEMTKDKTASDSLCASLCLDITHVADQLSSKTVGTDKCETVDTMKNTTGVGIFSMFFGDQSLRKGRDMPKEDLTDAKIMTSENTPREAEPKKKIGTSAAVSPAALISFLRHGTSISQSDGQISTLSEPNTKKALELAGIMIGQLMTRAHDVSNVIGVTPACK